MSSFHHIIKITYLVLPAYAFIIKSKILFLKDKFYWNKKIWRTRYVPNYQTEDTRNSRHTPPDTMPPTKN